LGEVPSHWGVHRIGSLFREVAEDGVEGLPILSVSIHDGVSDKELSDEEMDRKVTRSDDLSKYKKVLPEDLVYNMMRAWQGGFGAVATEGMVSPAYVVARPTSAFSTKFIELLLRTPGAIEEMRRYSKGVTDFRLRLYWDEFKAIKLVLPPSDEQFLIAAFLDRETGKIDALVSEQEKLIALLKEKRQAVISHAVTKGLDPAAPMRDSGVEWLGEVPAHWDVVRLKRIAILQRGHDLPAEVRVEGEVPVISSGGFTGTHNVSQAKAPGIVTGRYGTIGEFTYVDSDYWPLNTSLYTIEMYENDPRYIWYALQSISEHFTLNSLKAAVPGVDRNDVHTVFVARPSPSEQAGIALYLDAQMDRLEELSAEASHAIGLLKERRSALISAAVTGKIDVRGLVGAVAA
jgi:type I restriction enzyme S subunit